MVRKAETLKSIGELTLSGPTKRMVDKKFGTDTRMVVEIGRGVALDNLLHPEHAEIQPKYLQQLVVALDEAGFIRHDFYPRTWCVWGLYIAILKHVPFEVATISNRRRFISGEEYENMLPVSDEDFSKIMTALDSLSFRERAVLVLRFGFDDGVPRSLAAVGEAMCITRKRVVQLQTNAVRKLRIPSYMCKLPALFGFIPRIESKKLGSEDGTKIIDTDADIYYLDLSVRAYNCLRRTAHIKTIEDILNFPKEDWPLIKNLGRKSTLEIQDRMRAAGYLDFSIKAPS